MKAKEQMIHLDDLPDLTNVEDRSLPEEVHHMDAVDAAILNILRSRATWAGGKCYLSMRELQDLYTARHPGERCPTSSQVQAIVRHCVKRRLLKWALTVDGGLCYIV